LWLLNVGYTNKVKQILLHLVIEAEAIYGEKTGDVKFAYVAEKVYTFLPSVVKMFITTKEVQKLINTAVEQMKEYLADDKIKENALCISIDNK
jgi:hypothetical protein